MNSRSDIIIYFSRAKNDLLWLVNHPVHYIAHTRE